MPRIVDVILFSVERIPISGLYEKCAIGVQMFYGFDTYDLIASVKPFY